MPEFIREILCDLFHDADRFLRDKAIEAGDRVYWCRRCAKERTEYGPAASGW